MRIIRLVQRYIKKLRTKKDIEEFNKFYNLEESRINQEQELQENLDKE